MWYNLNGGVNNSIASLSGTIDQAAWAALPEGNVNLTFYADDLVGNIGYAEISITKSPPSSGIPGFNPFILISIMFIIIGVISLIILKKRLKFI